jgi:hypothetical protein
VADSLAPFLQLGVQPIQTVEAADRSRSAMCGQEAGRTAPSLPKLVAAVAALGDAIGRPVSLAELVAGNDPVQINEKLSLDKSALHAALTGGSMLPYLAEVSAPSC